MSSDSQEKMVSVSVKLKGSRLSSKQLFSGLQYPKALVPESFMSQVSDAQKYSIALRSLSANKPKNVPKIIKGPFAEGLPSAPSILDSQVNDKGFLTQGGLSLDGRTISKHEELTISSFWRRIEEQYFFPFSHLGQEVKILELEQGHHPTGPMPWLVLHDLNTWPSRRF